MKTEKPSGSPPETPTFDIESPDVLVSRELSWLGFARRVLALAETPDLPLFERIKFVGIMGMLHDEFFMKRISGMKRRMETGSTKQTQDGHLAEEEYEASRAEIWDQIRVLTRVVQEEIRPGLAAAGTPILDHDDLDAKQREALRRYFETSVQPILTPLAVDAEHPFPFISNLGLNLAAVLPNSRNGAAPVRAHQGAGQPPALGAGTRRCRLRAARAGDRGQHRPDVRRPAPAGHLRVPRHPGRRRAPGTQRRAQRRGRARRAGHASSAWSPPS